MQHNAGDKAGKWIAKLSEKTQMLLNMQTFMLNSIAPRSHTLFVNHGLDAGTDSTWNEGSNNFIEALTKKKIGNTFLEGHKCHLIQTYRLTGLQEVKPKSKMGIKVS